VTQTGALASDIAFSCSGLPAGWSCGFNPATAPAGSGPTQVMLTLQAGSGTAQNLPLTPMNGPGRPRHIWFSALVLMLGIHFTVRRGNPVYLRPAVALGLAALFLLVQGVVPAVPTEWLSRPRQSPPTARQRGLRICETRTDGLFSLGDTRRRRARRGTRRVVLGEVCRMPHSPSTVTTLLERTAYSQKEYFKPKKILRLPPSVNASSRNPGLVMRASGMP
jgi:hypothetical protein